MDGSAEAQTGIPADSGIILSSNPVLKLKVLKKPSQNLLIQIQDAGLVNVKQQYFFSQYQISTISVDLRVKWVPRQTRNPSFSFSL